MLHCRFRHIASTSPLPMASSQLEPEAHELVRVDLPVVVFIHDLEQFPGLRNWRSQKKSFVEVHWGTTKQIELSQNLTLSCDKLTLFYLFGAYRRTVEDVSLTLPPRTTMCSTGAVISRRNLVKMGLQQQSMRNKQ